MARKMPKIEKLRRDQEQCEKDIHQCSKDSTENGKIKLANLETLRTTIEKQITELQEAAAV
jgi:hypothetical protein